MVGASLRPFVRGAALSVCGRYPVGYAGRFFVGAAAILSDTRAAFLWGRPLSCRIRGPRARLVRAAGPALCAPCVGLGQTSAVGIGLIGLVGGTGGTDAGGGREVAFA